MTEQRERPSTAPTAPGDRPISTPDDLKRKCLRPGDPSNAAMEAIASAEKAMDDLSVNFGDWMSEESLRLRNAHDHARAHAFAAGSLDELFHASHDIKGQASTLGFPLAAEICASLCQLLEAADAQIRIPPQLVDQHVAAVRAIVLEQASGNDNPTAILLLERLQDVTRDYIAGERSRMETARESA